ncbi:MAG: DUF533 domain-containing protein [Gemmobacter sp.]
MSLLATLANVALAGAGYGALRNEAEKRRLDQRGGALGWIERMSRPRANSPLDRLIAGLRQRREAGEAGFDPNDPFALVVDAFQKSDVGRRVSGWMGGDDAAAAAGSGSAPSGASAEPGFAERVKAAGEGQAVQTSPEHEAVAALLLRAMIQGARADGHIDPDQRDRIVAAAEKGTAQDINFVLREMSAPVDARALAAATPPDLAEAVYAAAASTARADNPAESAFLSELAAALGLDRDTGERVVSLREPGSA